MKDYYSQAKCDKALKKLIKWTKNYNKTRINIKGLDEIDVSIAIDYLIQANKMYDLCYDFIYLMGNKMKCDIQTNESGLRESIAKLEKYRYQ